MGENNITLEDVTKAYDSLKNKENRTGPEHKIFIALTALKTQEKGRLDHGLGKTLSERLEGKDVIKNFIRSGTLLNNKHGGKIKKKPTNRYARGGKAYTYAGGFRKTK